ncbi:PTS sugar transporter subunit IIA [Raineyella sp. W15-4]|uniref:PTS sugar transporter subunit IIA n=1 Tax=Raineyella sp. W15-4 TaxID=3081651 RepID=UPI00295590C1|nr:PTS sugar transporter subunit IIA [Raineyella sp. W15-4]WOQ17095.1 PTS sugar transporter subunit IIA [Raineyella sp. W15-4]
MALDLSTALPDAAVKLGFPAADWRAAVIAAGDALVSSGATTDRYTQEMVAAIDRLGPYIVIAPGIAIAHARPSDAVLRSGLSWVRLEVPVAFGHAHNDPVGLVIGLAARDHEDHLEVMSALAGALADRGLSAALATADTPARVRELLAGDIGD